MFLANLRLFLVGVLSVVLVACGQGGVPSQDPVNTAGVPTVAAGSGTYLIAGSVGTPVGVTTVTLTPTSGVASTVTADATGGFSFPLPAVGNYTLTPNNPSYVFNPSVSSISITNATTGRSGINFTPTTSYTISGAITGTAVQGVTVQLYGAGVAPISTVTDANGYYSFSGLANGSYTVIPTLSGYTFAPVNKVVNLLGVNNAGNGFVATTGSVVTTNASVSGTIAGAIKQGVTVLLYNATTGASSSTTTDANGFYVFSGLSNNNYTVIPSLNGYTFSPVNTPVTIAGGNSTANNFNSIVGTVTAGTYSVAGTVSGAITQGVTVLLHNPNSAVPMQAVTDVNGYYVFTGLSAGSYTAIPTLSGYTFSPATNIVSISAANVTGNNYTSVGAPVVTTNNLSGILTGDVKQGVTINLYGSTNASTTTDVNGFYQFTGLSNGLYTLIPSGLGSAYQPLNRVVTLGGVASSGNDFVSTKVLHSISGSAIGLLSGATITLSGLASATTTTDALGAYSFNDLANGNYSITPTMVGYAFSPLNSTISLSGANQTGVNFAPTFIQIPTYTISGHITNRKGLAGNTINLTGLMSASTVTDSTGFYQFTGLFAGSYTVTPSSNAAGVTYNPLASSIDLKANGTLDFTGFDTINVNVTANQNNYDVKTALIAAGWDGVTKIYGNITINAGVTISANSSSITALSLTGVFPADSRITITNNGTIIGGTGTPGVGGVKTTMGLTSGKGGNGSNGGIALLINSASNNFITNNGVIAGGYGGGGGGGGGINDANCWGTSGTAGNANVGGSGGTTDCASGNAGAGGAGGNPYGTGIGAAGLSAANWTRWLGSGGNGGNIGAAINGTGNASWTAIGTIYGAQN